MSEVEAANSNTNRRVLFSEQEVDALCASLSQTADERNNNTELVVEGTTSSSSGGRRDDESNENLKIADDSNDQNLAFTESTYNKRKRLESISDEIGNNSSEQKLDEIWSNIVDSYDHDDADATEENQSCLEKADLALDETTKLLNENIDKIILNGLEVFNTNETLTRHLNQMTELAESRGREIERLKAIERDTNSSLTNLLRAVETSKSDARDISRAAQMEARLRNEISTLRSDRDEAIGTSTEANRKISILDEEVRLLKLRVNQLTQEKIKIERDSRAALSLARSMDHHASTDTDFYKRKVAELNDHLHSKNAQVCELKHQLEECRRQMERSISQNKLAQLRGKV